MKTLRKLYEAMQTLRDAGLSISNDLEKQINVLEEDIIKKDILPVIKEAIEPALKEVQREIVLVVDYRPGEPISLSLSRKTNVNSLISAKPIVAEPRPVIAPQNIVTPRNNNAYQPKPKSFANVIEIKRKFVSYMRRLNHKESTINGYINALDNHIPNFISKVYNNRNVSTFSYTDVEEVKIILKKLENNQDFRFENEYMHYEMSAALKKYLRFLAKID